MTIILHSVCSMHNLSLLLNSSWISAYRIAGKFGKLSMICQTKPSNLVLTINNLLADPLIRQTFFCQMLKKSQFTKLTFPLYGIYYDISDTILITNMKFTF